MQVKKPGAKTPKAAARAGRSAKMYAGPLVETPTGYALQVVQAPRPVARRAATGSTAPTRVVPAVRNPGIVRPHLTREDLRSMSDVGFKILMAMKEEWSLSAAQCLTLLGLEESNRSSWNLWLARFREGKDVGVFDRDRLERLSHLAQIYRGVTSAFPDDRHGLGWLTAPNTNPVFEGVSPLERMLGGRMQDLAAVQSYLEAVLMGAAG